MKKFILFFTVFIFCIAPAFANKVVYNTKTGKYHSHSCQWAKKCTVNCINIERQVAIKKGGVPCKVCGGR